MAQASRAAVVGRAAGTEPARLDARGLAVVELVQRGRMIVDVATVDLAAAERALGPFHETTWHFRQALDDARRSWERLRAELGSRTLEQALAHPPVAPLTLDHPRVPRGEYVLVAIAGRTYRAQPVLGTEPAPVQWRLTALRHDGDDDGERHDPYYVVRLGDGRTQCDCAEWTYRVADRDEPEPVGCKHVVGLRALGWI